jgi:hypothetical protein
MFSNNEPILCWNYGKRFCKTKSIIIIKRGNITLIPKRPIENKDENLCDDVSQFN